MTGAAGARISATVPGRLALYLAAEVRATLVCLMVAIPASLVFGLPSEPSASEVTTAILLPVAIFLAGLALGCMGDYAVRRLLVMSLDLRGDVLVIKAANRQHRPYRLLRTRLSKCVGEVIQARDPRTGAAGASAERLVFGLSVPLVPRWISTRRCLAVCGLTERTLDLWREAFQDRG